MMPKVGEIYIVLRTDSGRLFSKIKKIITIQRIVDDEIYYNYDSQFTHSYRNYIDWNAALEDGTIAKATPLIEALI
jgi:hypothetical protein